MWFLSQILCRKCDLFSDAKGSFLFASLTELEGESGIGIVRWAGERTLMQLHDLAWKGKTYTATTYTAENPVSFQVDGNNPVIEADFVGNYLLEVKANN